MSTIRPRSSGSTRLTALSFLALFVAVLVMGDVGGLPVDDPESEAGDQRAPRCDDEARHPTEGWAEVLRDRNLLRYGVVALLLLTFGYGSIESGPRPVHPELRRAAGESASALSSPRTRR